MPSHTQAERRKRNPKGRPFPGKSVAARKKFDKKRLARLSARGR